MINLGHTDPDSPSPHHTLGTVVDRDRQAALWHLCQQLNIPNLERVRWDLLDLALTHPTVSQTANYEQLEFVGDAVLRIAVAEFLFVTDPHGPVGEMSAVRSILVSDQTLASIAQLYHLDRYLLISSSAAHDLTGEETRLAEALEAILGALYLSTYDLSLINGWLTPHLHRMAEVIRHDPARNNYKAALQEWTQAHYKALPEYRVQEATQNHADPHRFIAEVWFQGEKWGEGTGRSRKQAEQEAAKVTFLSRCYPASQEQG